MNQSSPRYESAPPVAEAPKRFYGYTLAGFAFGLSFLASSFFLHSRGIFFPMWMSEFNMEKTEISLVVTAVLMTGSCCAPLTGYMIDRFPVRGVILFGAVWLAIGYTLLQWVDAYVPFLITLMLFQGIGWTCVGPLVQTKLMVNWFTRNRGMALGVAIMGISVAGVVMPTVVTFLSEQLGWRNAYTLYAAILVLLVIPLTLRLVIQAPTDIGLHPDGDTEPPPPTTAQSKVAAHDSIAVYKEVLTSKAFWSVVLTFGLMNGVYSAMATHLPTYLVTELDFDLYDASFVLGFAGGFAIAGKIAFGWLMDHVNAKGTVMFAVTSYVMSTIVFVNAQAYGLLLVAAGLFGLGFGGMVPVRSVLVSRLFGVKKFSRANGLLSFFLAPATLWVLITGMIADATGTYTSAFKVWTVAFLLAGLVTLIIRLPNRSEAVA